MVIVFSLTTINVIGVRDAAMVSDLFTIGKLIPIAFFIVVGLFFIDPQNFSPAAAPGVLSFSQSVMLLVYAFTGFEMALIPAGEVRDPQRNIPFAILAAVAATAFIYILIQVICIGTLPELAGSGRPIADAAGKFMGTAGAGVITAGVIVSIIGNLIVLILAAARLPFAMAERRELPGIFAGVHRRFRTPHVAIWVTGAVMLAITLSGTFIYAATISVIARLLAYAVTCLALLALRRKNEKPAVFVAPGGFFVSIAALALILWLLSNSTLSEARDAGIAAAVGLLVYAMKR
jgi:amino acid transporter